MLLWEALTVVVPTNGREPADRGDVTLQPVRLPYDRRCLKITKSGRRCRGRIRKGREYCPLHDPELAEARRRGNASRAARARNPLARLPDGYLRKLKTTAAVGNAMDRLYREVRLGVVTPEMGNVLFTILTRLMDSGLLDAGRPGPRAMHRTKAARFRPKLRDLLTRGERAAWQKAIANAPADVARANGKDQSAAESPDPARSDADRRRHPLDRRVKLALQQAS